MLPLPEQGLAFYPHLIPSVTMRAQSGQVLAKRREWKGYVSLSGPNFKRTRVPFPPFFLFLLPKAKNSEATGEDTTSR